ncbi:hypothetical protein HRbin36_01023 [bacterium HR36]|nr:hypothetical protein HRbin36_01023 [bacterium HR36]
MQGLAKIYDVKNRMGPELFHAVPNGRQVRGHVSESAIPFANNGWRVLIMEKHHNCAFAISSNASI